MKKYVVISAASILILACKAISIFLPSESTLPEDGLSSPESSAPSLTEPSTMPVDEKSLVGRNPSEWFPDPPAFSTLNNIPFQGYEAYTNEDFASLFYDPVTKHVQWQKELDIYNQTGRIVNYTYRWYIPECNQDSDAPTAEIMATIYKDAQGAQVGLESYSNLYNTSTNPKKEIEVGNLGYTAFFLTPSCNFSAWTAYVYFRRNNIFGIVGVTTYKLSTNFEKLDLALGLAKQLDRIILDEMAHYPGSSADLIALEETVKTIDISSSPPQNPPAGSGDPTDFITPLLSCTGEYELDGTYNLYGTVKNTSESPIMLTIDWGASDDATTIPFSDAWATRVTQTVKIAQNYTRTINFEGDEVILDNFGSPYVDCEIYSVEANWVK